MSRSPMRWWVGVAPNAATAISSRSVLVEVQVERRELRLELREPAVTDGPQTADGVDELGVDVRRGAEAAAGVLDGAGRPCRHAAAWVSAEVPVQRAVAAAWSSPRRVGHAGLGGPVEVDLGRSAATPARRSSSSTRDATGCVCSSGRHRRRAPASPGPVRSASSARRRRSRRSSCCLCSRSCPARRAVSTRSTSQRRPALPGVVDPASGSSSGLSMAFGVTRPRPPT